ncbi:hypothetical protein KUTeg_000130 [Tegillarca granosa]|uniref:pyrroline-5-carboxylate reductase n=1 Tax=Tegillarca granosa TaxID=220873 RepID=A0ABQ9FWT0_TEGGR|nr:hypothetical protein KUTeg_000130 [Tegillarca granosa]
MAESAVRRKHVPENMTVGFIGSGRMAQAMAKGFISTGIIKANHITASDPDPRMLKHIASLGVTTTENNKEVVNKSKMVVLAVKPNIVPPVLREVSEVVSKDKIVVSIAAASVLAPGSKSLPEDKDLVSELLRCIGICETGSEGLLDAVTGLSGSGPAYAFAAIESLADGGVLMGLPRDLATKLAAQTLLGAAKMVLESGKHPGQLKDEVCSPGGTTIAAMHKLEKGGFRGSLIDAVQAATNRAKELGAKK